MIDTQSPYRVVVWLDGTAAKRPAVYADAPTLDAARELASTYALTISNRITVERFDGSGWRQVADAGPMISCGFCEGPVCSVCGGEG